MERHEVTETPAQTTDNRQVAEEQAQTLEQKIIQALTAATGTLDTLRVAKAVVGPNATQGQVNPTLYAMYNKGILERMDGASLGVSRPSWRLVANYEEVFAAATQLEDSIVDVIRAQSNMAGPSDSLSALQIAKTIFGPKATKKDVNPTLYAMQEKGKLCQVADQVGIRWKLA